jgi:hypothetical protein
MEEEKTGAKKKSQVLQKLPSLYMPMEAEIDPERAGNFFQFAFPSGPPAATMSTGSAPDSSSTSPTGVAVNAQGASQLTFHSKASTAPSSAAGSGSAMEAKFENGRRQSALGAERAEGKAAAAHGVVGPVRVWCVCVRTRMRCV